MKAYSIASAAANINELGPKAIWQDKATGTIYFGDFEDLPASYLARMGSSKPGYIELSERELLEQEAKRFHF